ncbi:hypothetical protein Syun_022557 [Stephania yunnanensis]|uniref:Uncharacterized protein n=1 Tax=Stephania yunnanensis TaxID=152371 RepID=A0AAP0I2V2_9MAGN
MDPMEGKESIVGANFVSMGMLRSEVRVGVRIEMEWLGRMSWWNEHKAMYGFSEGDFNKFIY